MKTYTIIKNITSKIVQHKSGIITGALVSYEILESLNILPAIDPNSVVKFVNPEAPEKMTIIEDNKNPNPPVNNNQSENKILTILSENRLQSNANIINMWERFNFQMNNNPMIFTPSNNSNRDLVDITINNDGNDANTNIINNNICQDICFNNISKVIDTNEALTAHLHGKLNYPANVNFNTLTKYYLDCLNKPTTAEISSQLMFQQRLRGINTFAFFVDRSWYSLENINIDLIEKEFKYLNKFLIVNMDLYPSSEIKKVSEHLKDVREKTLMLLTADKHLIIDRQLNENNTLINAVNETTPQLTNNNNIILLKKKDAKPFQDVQIEPEEEIFQQVQMQEKLSENDNNNILSEVAFEISNNSIPSIPQKNDVNTSISELYQYYKNMTFDGGGNEISENVPLQNQLENLKKTIENDPWLNVEIVKEKILELRMQKEQIDKQLLTSNEILQNTYITNINSQKEILDNYFSKLNALEFSVNDSLKKFLKSIWTTKVLTGGVALISIFLLIYKLNGYKYIYNFAKIIKNSVSEETVKSINNSTNNTVINVVNITEEVTKKTTDEVTNNIVNNADKLPIVLNKLKAIMLRSNVLYKK